MNRILVAVDASPRATRVLHDAVDMAQKMGGKITVLRVVGLPVEIPLETWAVPPADLTDTLVDENRKSVEALVATLPPGIVDGVLVEVGIAWQAICDIAAARKCDLIVLGTHGHGMLDRLLGTTASRVANHAPCSVFMVRPDEARTA